MNVGEKTEARVPWPSDNDRFLVDVRRGNHYHVVGCMVIDMGPHGSYQELSLAEIRELRTSRGDRFAPDACVLIEAHERAVAKVRGDQE